MSFSGERVNMKSGLCLLFVLASALCAPSGHFEDGRPSEADEVSDSLSLWESFDTEELTENWAGQIGVAPHIVGGEEAKRHAYPHAVFLEITLGNGRRSFCGASLISPQWIITAAHCVNKVKQINAVLGIHDRREKEEKSRQRIKISKIIVEEKYRFQNTDIALLNMEKPAQLNQFVQPIRLPAWSEKSKNLTGIPAEVIGWGTYGSPKRETSPVLRVAPTKILSNEECSKRARSITPWRICSDSSRKKQPCHGDSGGSIFITEPDNVRTIVGIVSYGSHDCQGGHPAVYTRVDSWLEWINKLTGISIRK